jgi:hypothetical protein
MRNWRQLQKSDSDPEEAKDLNVSNWRKLSPQLLGDQPSLVMMTQARDAASASILKRTSGIFMLRRIVCAILLSHFALGCSDSANSRNGLSTQQGGEPESASVAEPPFELLDLDVFDRLPDAKPPGMRSRTMLMYDAPGKAVESYAVLKKKLAAAHWRELPGGTSSAEYDSAVGYFKRGDHVLTLSISKASQPDLISVTLQHLGNLEISKLPIPKGAESVYQFPQTAGYVTAAGVDETVKAFGDAMATDGWSVFESSPGATTYKRGAQTVQAYISSAPAQGGKTMIQLSPQLLPVDLPVPPKAEDVRFSHGQVELRFTYPGDWDEVAKFYQKELPALGWTPTTENLIKNEDNAFQIYRNAEKALTELKIETRGGKTQATVEYQSPTIFEENEKRFQEYRKKKEAEQGTDGAKPEAN